MYAPVICHWQGMQRLQLRIQPEFAGDARFSEYRNARSTSSLPPSLPPSVINAAAQQFSVPVLKSDTGLEYVDDTTYDTYFVVKEFEGLEYDVLCRTAHRFVCLLMHCVSCSMMR